MVLETSHSSVKRGSLTTGAICVQITLCSSYLRSRHEAQGSCCITNESPLLYDDYHISQE